MARKMQIALVALGLLTGVPAQAQPPQPAPLWPTLSQAVRNGWLQFSVASGRITVAGSRFGNISTTSDNGNRRERLNIRTADGDWLIEYEASTPAEQFSIEVKSGNQVHLRRTPKGNSALVPVEFVQVPEEALTLSVGPEGHCQVYRAASLWHLLITQTEVCGQHLVPMLELPRPDWRLIHRALELEEELLRAATAGRLPDRQRWAALVVQLGDERFPKREAADRELRAAGPAVLSYLQHLDYRRLDAEQQWRVRRIIATLSQEMDDDTPQQVASWMAGDAVVWLALLSRQEQSARQAAAEQLSKLLGEPIAFDPGADPETRKAQLQRLGAKVPQN